MKKYALLFSLMALFSSALSAQTPAVASAFAVLTKGVDAKTAAAGQELTMLTTSDVIVDRVVVIPKGAKLLGHIADIRLKGGDVQRSYFSVVIDKAVRDNGSELPLQAIIATVAAPPEGNLEADPTFAMLHSGEPKMAGSAGSSSTSGEMSASSKSSSGAAVATANLKGGGSGASLLDENSQGAIGYEGLQITWQLTSPPPTTIFTLIKGKNLKLDAGTQLLLRMAPPRPAR